MTQKLPVMNWSIRKLLNAEPDSFNKARIRILFMILMFSLVKILLVLGVAFYHQQYFQLFRGLIILFFYITVVKIMLIGPKMMKPVTHVVVWVGILIVFSNLFVGAQAINIISLQFINMIFLSSFYLLNRNYGILYSTISTAPVLVYVFWQNPVGPFTQEPLATPGTITLIILNFISLIAAHYLYHDAFSETLREKEKLNDQLQEAVLKANRLAASKSDFLSTMSHELRTPLNAVIGLSDLLQEDARSPEQKENLKTLHFSAQSLHALINDILDFNKLESEKLHLESIPINLANLLEGICAGLNIQAREKGLELIFEADERLRQQPFITDPTRISQIIYNLGGNALKFTSKGMVTISAKVLNSAESTWLLRFAVKDTGIGIPAHKLEEIFEPFVQASTSTTRNYGGTGLGLSIVKRLLLLFNSKMQVESVPGLGSTFYFDLELKPAKESEPLHQDGGLPQESLKGIHILLAEDNPVNVYVVKRLCQKWDIRLTAVENGLQVLEKMETEDFDLILMDIHMPEMDGYETARNIRRLTDKAIPIIALTASASNDVQHKIKQAGMNAHVSKPFNATELYRKMEKLISKNSGLL